MICETTDSFWRTTTEFILLVARTFSWFSSFALQHDLFRCGMTWQNSLSHNSLRKSQLFCDSAWLSFNLKNNLRTSFVSSHVWKKNTTQKVYFLIEKWGKNRTIFLSEWNSVGQWGHCSCTRWKLFFLVEFSALCGFDQPERSQVVVPRRSFSGLATQAPKRSFSHLPDQKRHACVVLLFKNNTQSLKIVVRVDYRCRKSLWADWLAVRLPIDFWSHALFWERFERMMLGQKYKYWINCTSLSMPLFEVHTHSKLQLETQRRVRMLFFLRSD